VETGFSIDRMTDDYLSLFERLTLPGGRIA
jgi:hypothetical protein